jgi:AraC-like DNA-binding protein
MDEAAYGPLVRELERRLALPSRPPGRGARPDGAHKRRLLRLARERFGPRFLPTLGRSLSAEVGHPFIRALAQAPSPEVLLQRWCRLEVLAHSHNRVVVLEVGPRHVQLRRTRAGGGAPTGDEDALVLGLLAGLLERAGARGVRWRAVRRADGTAGRAYRLQWQAREAPAPLPPARPVGTRSDVARAAFALLLEASVDAPHPSLAVLARRLCTSARSLQRHLADAGTSYRDLVRSARVALAGDAISGGSRSLGTVAYACGFSDSAHLSREFRALVGTTPVGFRRAVRTP